MQFNKTINYYAIRIKYDLFIRIFMSHFKTDQSNMRILIFSHIDGNCLEKQDKNTVRVKVPANRINNLFRNAVM